MQATTRTLLSLFSDESMDIEKRLRVEDFRLLPHRFNRSAADRIDFGAKSKEKSSSKIVEHTKNGSRSFRAGSLNKEEFVDAFESIVDLSQYGNQLEKLFDKGNRRIE